MMDFVGLDREFSQTVVPLGADDPDVRAFHEMRMLGQDAVPPYVAARLGSLTREDIREVLRTEYRLLPRDTRVAVVRCLENILRDQGKPVGFEHGDD